LRKKIDHQHDQNLTKNNQAAGKNSGDLADNPHAKKKSILLQCNKIDFLIYPYIIQPGQTPVKPSA